MASLLRLRQRQRHPRQRRPRPPIEARRTGANTRFLIVFDALTTS